tara:strand:- start:55 stop:936 length:882 start_codon:yes stop_codon:yes gene_type:complete
MYYPKSQIIENLYTNGGEYAIKSTNKEYKGYYYQVSNNQRFTGKNSNDLPNNLLVPLRSNVDYGGDEINFDTKKGTFWTPSYRFNQKQQGVEITTAPQAPRQTIPQPTEQDYTNGAFDRYFLYNFNNKNTLEVDERIYTQYIDKSPSVQYQTFTPLQIVWTLIGKEKEVSKANFNSVRITEERNKTYGFSKYFNKKYNQYYQYGINENLYTDGTEFRNKRTGKPYMGYYHIHPEKGPMVGKQHIKKAHDYLESILTGSILNPLPPSPQSGSYVEPTREVNISIGGSAGGSGGY